MAGRVVWSITFAPTPIHISEDADLNVMFPDIKALVIKLKGRYSRGQITISKLEKELFKLIVRDENNIWWMIGINTLNWYFYDSINLTWILRGSTNEPILPG